MTYASQEVPREIMEFVETPLNSSGKKFHRPLLPSPSLRKQERLGGLGQQRSTRTAQITQVV